MNLLKSKKISFRENMREKFSKLEAHVFEQLSVDVSSNLLNFLNQNCVIQNKKIIGAFAPIEKEPLWYKNQDLEKWQLAFPSIDEANQMVFRESKIIDLKSCNDFGSKILGPEKSNTIVVPSYLLIPGIGFSLKGERLGRGKGYFDRYLASFSGVKIGIGFEMQLSSELPCEEHDINCDWLITEKNIYKFN